MIDLAALNALPAAEFAPALEGIFEHSPWVAQRTAPARPFASRLDLLDAMRGVVARAGSEDQLRLIRAHPKLGARGRSRGQLTPASQGEQRRAGLDACSDAQFALLEALNREYEARFDIPFILAVRGHGPASIIAAMRRRLSNEVAAEHLTALREIGLIAGYRLTAVVRAPAAAEARAMMARLAGADADGVTAAVHDRLREWLLAANFELLLDADGVLLGRRQTGGAPGPCLLLGVQSDAAHGALRHQGLGPALLALTVVGQWSATAAQRPVDVLWLLRTAPAPRLDATAFVVPPSAGPAAPLDATLRGGDGDWVLEALQRAGIATASVRLAATADRSAAAAPGLDAAAAALENDLSTFGSPHV
jgi:OHCU decarboxylase